MWKEFNNIQIVILEGLSIVKQAEEQDILVIKANSNA